MNRGNARQHRLRTAARVAFCTYAPLLFIATHWPGLRVEGPVPRSDLLAHLGAFGLWGLVFIACAWFGPALSARNIDRAGLIGLIYAAIDEALQGVPGLNRFVSVQDWLANALGIVCAVLAASVASRLMPRA
ncbi:MAG: VanZ family protein [Planctomycetota bacterium]